MIVMIMIMMKRSGIIIWEALENIRNWIYKKKHYQKNNYLGQYILRDIRDAS